MPRRPVHPPAWSCYIDPDMTEPIVLLRALAVAGAAVAMVTDMRWGKIYNWLTFPLILVGWAGNAWFFGPSGLGYSVAATFVGFALFLGFALLGVVGMGDVKLLGGIGALAGTQFTVAAFLLSSAVSIPHALIIQHLNYGRNALGMLLTSLTTGAFRQKTIEQENKSDRFKLYLGIDILVGCLLAWYLDFRITW